MVRKKPPGDGRDVSDNPAPKTRAYYLKDVATKLPALSVRREKARQRCGSSLIPSPSIHTMTNSSLYSTRETVPGLHSIDLNVLKLNSAEPGLGWSYPCDIWSVGA